MYSAIVSRVQTRKHPNADRLQLATAAGFQVIVGLSVEDGALGVFFPADGQLSDEFCKENDLYPRFDKNGKKVGGGFIEPKNRRVRAQSFRGEKSYGFWVPVSHFDYTGAGETLEEGFEFSELNGHEICNKYVNKATREAGKSRAANRRKETEHFRRHVKTEQFWKSLRSIKKGDLLTISRKLHGTSFRHGYVLDLRKLNIIERILKFFGFKVEEHEYTRLTGSRNIILEKGNGKGFYGDDAFRYEAVSDFTNKLLPGEVVYGEIVGWVNESRPIMPRVSTKSLPKEHRKQDFIEWTYGNAPGEREVYIYRIVMNIPKGESVELSPQHLLERCAELGVKPVPQIGASFVFDGRYDALAEKVQELTDAPDELNRTSVSEGVVVRVDAINGETFFLKSKSHNFYVLEGVHKDSNAIDIEEAS